MIIRLAIWLMISLMLWIGIYLAANTIENSVARVPEYRSSGTCYALHGRTASGAWTNRRTVAHNFLPFGTKIRLTGRPFLGGRRLFIVQDTGPALRDGHFDFWWPSASGCMSWGHRKITYKKGWAKP